MAIKVVEILKGVVQKTLERCRVSQPARVKVYDRATRRADVQPQVRRRFRDGQTQEQSPLLARPVVLPRGGGYGMWFDLADGDPVVTLVGDEDARAFYETGQPATPTFGVRHNPGDAVVFPGGVPDPEQPTVNGVGEFVVGGGDLTSAIIFRRGGGPSLDELGTTVVAAAGPTASVLLGGTTAAVPPACEPQVLANLQALNTMIQALPPVPGDPGVIAALKTGFGNWAAALQSMADAKVRMEGPTP